MDPPRTPPTVAPLYQGFKEERVAKVGLYAIGTSTTLESNKSLAQMVRARAAERLELWLEGVLASPWRELKRFAQGLRQDYAAVKAALTSRYSNGPTEGHVNRLKLFKRQMYGRAKLDLLRQRVLYAA